MQEREDLRARVSQLLLTPPNENTDQLIRMAEDCLASLRRKRIEDRLQSIMQSINTLSGAEKQSAMAEVQLLSAQLKRLKSPR